MRYIEKSPDSIRHALHQDPDVTLCGRRIKGHTGHTIVGLIDCQQCRRILIKMGFQLDAAP